MQIGRFIRVAVFLWHWRQRVYKPTHRLYSQNLFQAGNSGETPHFLTYRINIRPHLYISKPSRRLLIGAYPLVLLCGLDETLMDAISSILSTLPLGSSWRVGKKHIKIL
jgi:hypothetical protein